MADPPSRPAGTPTWVDLSSPDPEASATFYGSLFGWTAGEPAGPEFGGYRMLSLGDRVVAGAGGQMGGAQPAAWQVYVASDDVDATLSRARDAGGTVVMGPFDILDAGRMAVLRDPGGAFLGLWQGDRHTGAQVVGEPGSYAWAELYTPDIATARRFYGDVLGWESKESDMGEGQGAYTEFTLAGRSVAGGMEIGRDLPGDVPPHWLPYFAVADVDATVGRLGELGGSPIRPPADFPGGRFAILADPHHAVFGVLRMAA